MSICYGNPKKQTYFLSFLPDNESSNRKKARMNDLTAEKIKVNDVSTGFASETFIVILSSRSKAATGIMAARKNYLTNTRRLPDYIDHLSLLGPNVGFTKLRVRLREPSAFIVVSELEKAGFFVSVVNRTLGPNRP